MKLAIVGSRTFNDYELMADIIMNHFWDVGGDIPTNVLDTIISGGAKGADSVGKQFAHNYKIPVEIYLPEWDKWGKTAGFFRNQQIVDACDIVLAFWDGYSPGTKDTIERAKQAKKPTFIVYF